MRGVLPVSLSGTAKIAALAGLLSLTAACSADVSRLQQPFFPEADKNDVTGSLGPVPKANLGGARTWDEPPVRTARSDSAITAGPVTTTPIERRSVPRASEDGFTIVTAEPGETAHTMSRRYGVSVRHIMAANDLARADDLRPGQDVRIPPVDWEPARPSLAAEKPGTPAAGERVHVVAAGDTLSAIARRHGMSSSQIARHNGMESADRLRVGQRIRIPAEAEVQVASVSPDAGLAASARVPVPSRRPTPAAVQSVRSDPVSEPAARRAAEPERQEQQVAAVNPQPERVRSGPLPEPDAMSSDKFRWPVRGRVISGFGTKPNGAQNDGINIAVPEGTSVKAAENGVVAYVGNELKGYGNLILVRHADDWVTAYAHNSQTLVRRGDKVTRGQIIAIAGQTGAVSSPQLHFELRKGSRPVDPLPRMAEN